MRRPERPAEVGAAHEAEGHRQRDLEHVVGRREPADAALARLSRAHHHGLLRDGEARAKGEHQRFGLRVVVGVAGVEQPERALAVDPQPRGRVGQAQAGHPAQGEGEPADADPAGGGALEATRPLPAREEAGIIEELRPHGYLTTLVYGDDHADLAPFLEQLATEARGVAATVNPPTLPSTPVNVRKPADIWNLHSTH